MNCFKGFIVFSFINILSAAEVSYPLKFDSEESFYVWVGKKAAEYYQKINEDVLLDGTPKFRYQKQDEYRCTFSDMWETFRHCGVGTGFRLKVNMVPSDALRDFLNKGAIFECMCALQLVVQLIRLDLLGDVLFNEDVDIEGLEFPMLIQNGVCSAGNKIPLKPGEYGYFSNVSDYHEIHPRGIAKGQNVFCVDLSEDEEPLYMGFGEFFNVPRTANEVIENLYQNTIENVYSSQCLSFMGSFGGEDYIQSYYVSNKSFWCEKREEAQQKIFNAVRFSYSS